MMSGVSRSANDQSSSPTNKPADTIQGAPPSDPASSAPAPQKLLDATLTDTLILPDSPVEKVDSAPRDGQDVQMAAPDAPSGAVRSDGAPPKAPASDASPEGAMPTSTALQPATPQTTTQELRPVKVTDKLTDPDPAVAEDKSPAESAALAPETTAPTAEAVAPTPEVAPPVLDIPVVPKLDNPPPVSAPAAETTTSAATPATAVTKPFPELAASGPQQAVSPEPAAASEKESEAPSPVPPSSAAPAAPTAVIPSAETSASVERAEPVAAVPTSGDAPMTAPATAEAEAAVAASAGAASPAPAEATSAPQPAADVATTTPAGESAPAPAAPTGEAASPEVRACPVCGSRVREGELACSFCGHVLTLQGKTNKFDPETEVSARKSWPTGEVLTTEQKPITFEIEGKQLTLMIAESITVGRNSDIPGDALPDVDLGPYGASETGVSRRHIRIRRKGILLYVADLNSTNGTLLNGRKLIPEGERLIRSGDELRLGHLKIRVRF